MERDSTYSIVIPAYNESQRIAASLDKILAYIAQQNWVAEVIVVNDGSRDNTAEIVRGYMRQHSIVRLLENPGNKGKGDSVRHGMMEAQVEGLNDERSKINPMTDGFRMMWEMLRVRWYSITGQYSNLKPAPVALP